VQASQYVIKKARKKSVDGYELTLTRSGAFYVRFNQVSEGRSYKLSSFSSYPTDGSWIHLAATFDGQEIKLYRDGVLENSMDASGLVIAANDLPLAIGGQDNGVKVYNGALDEVHLYDRALSDAEVQALFTSQGPPP
jgi:hypothetical protein